MNVTSHSTTRKWVHIFVIDIIHKINKVYYHYYYGWCSISAWFKTNPCLPHMLQYLQFGSLRTTNGSFASSEKYIGVMDTFDCDGWCDESLGQHE